MQRIMTSLTFYVCLNVILESDLFQDDREVLRMAACPFSS